jgi:proton-dependent oligopeptide transporter, POT family
MATESPSIPAAQEVPAREFLGHPRGLATLFMTEFFERYTYYGMRGMLVLFLVASTTAVNPGFGMDERTANAIYGLYAGGVYLFSVPGGWIADRLIGQRKAVFWGGIVIAIGNLILAIPATAPVFFLGLAVIVIGVGLLKPNISTIVGSLYHGLPGAKRDAGFSIFYMGINLGAFLAPLTAGTLGEGWNWRLGFLVCGLAMLAGVVLYKFNEKNLGTAGLEIHSANDQERSRGWKFVGLGLALIVAIGALMFTGIIPVEITRLAEIFGIGMWLLAIVFFGIVLIFAKLTGEERKRVGVIAIFFLCAAIFWAGFEQQATSFNLFALEFTDRSLFGSWFPEGQHPANWYQSANPIFIIIFAPFFAWLWTSLGARNLDPSSPAKFGLGLVLLGMGFLVMMFAAQLIVSSGGKVGPTWLLMAYLIHTFGELCLSPVGLSNITKLAPQRFVGQMMGTWFLGSAVGNLFAGLIGGHIASAEAAHLPKLFLQMTWFGAIAGVIMLLLARPLRGWIGSAR